MVAFSQMMKFSLLSFLILSSLLAAVTCNTEGDALYAWKKKLKDPNNILQSWDPTLPNPCTWFHVTCDYNDSIIRVDLGNAGLSGVLVPQLGHLKNLQYLEVYKNKLTGEIPRQLGSLAHLTSLDFSENHLSGPIPSSFQYLRSMRWMRLNGNRLTGVIPTGVLELVRLGNLEILDVSRNSLAGSAKRSKSNRKRRIVITQITQDQVA